MRIGVSKEEFVVLNRTTKGVYHGHVRAWRDLSAPVQNILRDNNIVTKLGKFIR